MFARLAAAVSAAVVVALVMVPVPAGARAAAGAGGDASAVAAALRTPVLSLRRAPQLLRTGVALSRLDTALDSTLADTSLQRSVSTSCLVVQAGSTTIYQRNPTTALAPASNLKLLTAAAALDKLPANLRLVTSVTAGARPEDGKVTGNLYLVGGGDPLLFTADYAKTLSPPAPTFDDLASLAAQVKQAGITVVTGSVVGDESRYDNARGVASWAPSYLATAQVGPLSALLVNDGFATFKPGPVPASNPAQQAAATFTTLLAAQGVAVTGPPLAGSTPASASPVTRLASPPLPQVVAEMLLRSDNDTAELLTKELGREATGQGTTAAGVSAIVADLAADGLPTAGLRLVDGSGLDRSDRATCGLILGVLARGGPSSAIAAGLPLAAKSGTLAGRMARTPAAGRLRAKTGTLNGVASLSGFVAPAGAAPAQQGVAPAGAAPAQQGVGAGGLGAGGLGAGGLGAGGLAFSLLSNSVPTDAAGTALGDRVGVALANFPDAPPLTPLSPLP